MSEPEHAELRATIDDLRAKLAAAEERGRRFESAAKWLVEAYDLRQDLSAVMLEFGGLLAQNTSERQRPRA